MHGRSFSHISEDLPGWHPSHASCTMTTTEMIGQRFKTPADVPPPAMPADFLCTGRAPGNCAGGITDAGLISRHQMKITQSYFLPVWPQIYLLCLKSFLYPTGTLPAPHQHLADFHIKLPFQTSYAYLSRHPWICD